MTLSDPSLFNERAADAIAMQSLHNEISRLREELQMSQVIKSTDGKYYVGEFEEVTPDQVTEMIAHKQHQLAELEAIAPATTQDNGGSSDGQAAPDGNSQPSGNDTPAPSGDGSAPATPAAYPNAAPAGADAQPQAAPADQGQVTDPNAPAPAAPQAPNMQ